MTTPNTTPFPPTGPVRLVEVGRTDRAVLGNLGQLHRHDLSEAYRLLPNADGTYNNGRLDSFLAGPEPGHQAWLIMVADRLAGFVMTAPAPGGGRSVADFFVVRAARRFGVGSEAARQTVALFPGRWAIGFQSYNPGVAAFWSRLASELVGQDWRMFDDPPPPGRPADSWIVFDTGRPQP